MVRTGKTTTPDGVVTDPKQVGGYPNYSFTADEVPTDSDHDGMPDAWEQSNGLNPADPADGADRPRRRRLHQRRRVSQRHRPPGVCRLHEPGKQHRHDQWLKYGLVSTEQSEQVRARIRSLFRSIRASFHRTGCRSVFRTSGHATSGRPPGRSAAPLHRPADGAGCFALGAWAITQSGLRVARKVPPRPQESIRLHAGSSFPGGSPLRSGRMGRSFGRLEILFCREVEYVWSANRVVDHRFDRLLGRGGVSHERHARAGAAAPTSARPHHGGTGPFWQLTVLGAEDRGPQEPCRLQVLAPADEENVEQQTALFKGIDASTSTASPSARSMPKARRS